MRFSFSLSFGLLFSDVGISAHQKSLSCGHAGYDMTVQKKIFSASAQNFIFHSYTIAARQSEIRPENQQTSYNDSPNAWQAGAGIHHAGHHSVRKRT
jgi:hypothetical protein